MSGMQVIRILVVYTDLARIELGGQDQIEEHIQLTVETTNQSFIDSGVMVHLQLAGMREVIYTETDDLGQTLIHLRNPSDGQIDFVHDWRDVWYADLVSMVVAGSLAPTCYSSYIMANQNPTFEAFAFSVVRAGCMFDDLGFPKAIGQNLGARLDWYNDETKPPYTDYSYSHGHVDILGGWRTVMSEDFMCIQQSTSCVHLWRWSDGGDFGVHPGTSSNCYLGVFPPVDGQGNYLYCDADNVQVLNNNASTAAAFRSDTLTPYTLLVNDEGLETTEIGAYYTDALETLAQPYKNWHTTSSGLVEPGPIDLAPYGYVVWFTGRSQITTTGPGISAEAALAAWLPKKNCLLISSQSYAEAVSGQPTDFMRDYLGVQSLDSSVSNTIVTGLGPFFGLGPWVLTEPSGLPPGGSWDSSDIVQPSAAAQAAFDGDAGEAGLRYSTSQFHTSYLAFPLEMLPTDADRAALLGRFYDLCYFGYQFLPLIVR